MRFKASIYLEFDAEDQAAAENIAESAIDETISFDYGGLPDGAEVRTEAVELVELIDETSLSDRAIAARRGNVLERMGWPTVAEDVRAGLSLGVLVGRLDDDDDILPVVRGWIDG